MARGSAAGAGEPASASISGVAGRRRLFLAVAVDADTRAVLAAHLDAHGIEAWPGRLVPPANWHLTLRFLGWTTDVQRDRILADLDQMALPGPFRLRFDSLGAFPKLRRATVAWLGVADGVEPLSRLADACETAAQAAGFRPEDRPYHPHLTISRIRPAQDISERTASFPPFPVTMAVDAVTLFESHLAPGGANYTAIDAVRLAAR